MDNLNFIQHLSSILFNSELFVQADDYETGITYSDDKINISIQNL